MKKSIAILMILVLCLSLVTLTGCGEKKEAKPFGDYNLEEYITLPNYDTYTTKEPNVKIEDKDVETEIQSILEKAATTKSVKEGTVKKGDAVKVSFKGTLEDGSSPDGMNSESYGLTLGAGNMISGFEEGLFGATIGEPVTLDLKFPDPYTNSPELSGKPVTFVVTVLSKEVPVVPELNDEFVKENSDVKTVEEFRALIKKQLEQDEYDNQLYDLKNEIYEKIVSETELLKTPEKELNEQIKVLDDKYKELADQKGYEDWDKFLDEYFKVDQAEYDEQIKLYAEAVVKQEMIIYALAEKENLEVTEKEYQDYLDQMLAASGFKDGDAFKQYAGMTIEEYAKTYKLDRDLLLTKELDAIYDRLEKK